MTAQALLAVSGLRVEYGGLVAVHDVEFAVEPGQVFVLLGANGAGKTSTLRCISGLVRAAAGTVNAAGKSLLKMKPSQIAQLGIAHVPEGRRVFTDLTVHENLAVSHIPRQGRSSASALDDVFELFPRLAERRKQTAGTLSGGEQQMLAIGRAIMNAPDLLMLDEPSLGLSPLMVQLVFERLEAIRQRGIALLLVEQNASSLDIADYGIVLATGKAVLSGTKEELHASDFVRRAYLGC